MTPLAHRIVKELTLPVKHRTFKDQCGLLPRMNDIHCFEITDVLDAAFDLAHSEWKHDRTSDYMAFLPAPKTWIEFTHKSSIFRTGVLLESRGTDGAESRWAAGNADGFVSDPNVGWLKLSGDGLIGSKHFRVRPTTTGSEWTLALYAVLAMINTPRIIGRVQHMPHRGLEKALLANRSLVGKFPLRAWTEIKLHITPPVIAGVPEPVEAHLTGRKAYHFVKAYTRVSSGKLVAAYWRGDPSLGIIRSRYRVTD